jgi:hypothetical protein
MSGYTFPDGFTTNAAGHGLIELTPGELRAAYDALGVLNVIDDREARDMFGSPQAVKAAHRALLKVHRCGEAMRVLGPDRRRR